MIELFKELVKEPENAKRYAISLLKLILIAIVTSKVYVYFFGNYLPILIGDANFWQDTYSFFLSGQILIVTFIFFGLKYVVFEIFTTIIYLIIYLITSKIKKSKSTFKDSNFFRGLFLIFNVINHNKEKDIIETDKNFDYVYSELISYEKDEIIDIFDKFKKSYIYEIFNIYSAFTLVYFFILDYNSFFFSFLIIIGFLLLLYSIFSFQYIYELIFANYEDLVFAMKSLKQIEITKKVLSENRIAIEIEVNKIFSNFITFKINGIELGIEHFLGQKLSSEQIKETNLPSDSKLILITSSKLPKLLEKKLKENSKLIIIEFRDSEEEFIELLENALFN
ncbi:MAG TPA: hypothetical protein PLP39_00700 [Flavobacterium lutivivi]|nr:hypothetical protein [Flavobacterium lutivivi]